MTEYDYTKDDEYSISEHYFCSEFEGTKEECEKYISEHSKLKYRPFKDCDELIKCYLDICYKKQMSPNPNNFINEWIELPTIWVKSKTGKVKSMITDFEEDTVDFSYSSVDMKYLFDNFTFLDGSPCGVEE